MGLVTVGLDLDGEAAPITLAVVKGGMIALEGLLVCDPEVSAANWLTVLCLANRQLKTAGLFQSHSARCLS